MRIFEKSVKLNNVCYDIRGPVMDEAGRMEAEGVKILKLNIGNPATFGFRAPQHLVDIMSSNLDKTEGYSDSRGLLSARQAIVEYDKKKGIEGVEVTDVYTGNGVSELITLSMQGLLDYGDEILVPSPDYPLWTASVSLAGGTAVHYICDEKSNWYPDLKDIERKITPRTKGIVVINPNNPTGALYPKEILEGIVKMAELHDLIIFADEIYDRLVMDGKKHISIASLTNKCLCITFNGLSKSHLVAGYRVGWMSISGAKQNAKGYLEGINMLSNMRLCSNVPAQS
ncbi:MAG: aminotransferase class I/II-fold pyridoxal phosphate-dependent enzyme, partial [Firmicutes bacterium]|nr:aminotransferase class I/II-fold pyridoxal phosphate-dependent enzyme [Bacillota bacterium]